MTVNKQFHSSNSFSIFAKSGENHPALQTCRLPHLDKLGELIKIGDFPVADEKLHLSGSFPIYAKSGGNRPALQTCRHTHLDKLGELNNIELNKK